MVNEETQSEARDVGSPDIAQLTALREERLQTFREASSALEQRKPDLATRLEAITGIKPSDLAALDRTRELLRSSVRRLDGEKADFILGDGSQAAFEAVRSVTEIAAYEATQEPERARLRTAMELCRELLALESTRSAAREAVRDVDSRIADLKSN
jgi:hypothetical protein